MYYDIVESGIRVKELRSVRNMTRQQLADEIGLSLGALRKIETGTNGAKIDTLVSIADVFHVPLDYLVCGCQQKAESASLNEKEVQFIRNIVLSVIDNMKLIKN